jgi:cobalt-zinc-cadmium efflux system membrane fusion protein
MQKNYSIIKSTLKYLEDDYIRQKTLSEQNVNARKVFLQAEKDYLSARAELEVMNQKLDLLKVNRSAIEEGHVTPFLSIRSPMSGYVNHINVVIGSFVDDQDILAEVINPEHLHAEINVYERDILKIRKGQQVEIRIPQIENLTIMGEVVLIDRELDEDARTATVHVDITENERLLSGMYVEANVLLDDKKVMAVPDGSLVREESRSFVYILTNQSEQNYTLKKEFVNVEFERQGMAVIHFLNTVDTTSMIAVGGVYYLSSRIE